MKHQKYNSEFIQRDQFIQKSIKREYYPTNNIMVDKKQKSIYLPGYMRLKFKNFNDLDIGGLSALLNGQIILVIFYGQSYSFLYLHQKSFIEEHLMKRIVLLFSQDNAIKLTSNSEENKQKQLDIKVSHNVQKHEIKFVVKKIFKLFLDSQVFLTPFEVINAILEVTVQGLEIQVDTDKWKVEFNLQNNKYREQKVQFANWGRFGNYDLAERKIAALYTNYRISSADSFSLSITERLNQFIALKSPKTDSKQGQKQQQKALLYTESKIESFHYAYFKIPLYKFPLSALITIFMPLFFLDVLNFGILFQDPGLSDRIAAVATLVLAFAALIPTIRDQIPPNPSITFIEILVYFQTVPTLLAILHSLDVLDLSQQRFVFAWSKNFFFWIAFTISAVTFLIIAVMLFLHYTKWFPEYNNVASRERKRKFDRKQWRNTQSNRYFYTNFQQQAHRQNKGVILTRRTPPTN